MPRPARHAQHTHPAAASWLKLKESSCRCDGSVIDVLSCHEVPWAQISRLASVSGWVFVAGGPGCCCGDAIRAMTHGVQDWARWKAFTALAELLICQRHCRLASSTHEMHSSRGALQAVCCCSRAYAVLKPCFKPHRLLLCLWVCLCDSAQCREQLQALSGLRSELSFLQAALTQHKQQQQHKHHQQQQEASAGGADRQEEVRTEHLNTTKHGSVSGASPVCAGFCTHMSKFFAVCCSLRLCAFFTM